jgi:small Trp-rich protein
MPIILVIAALSLLKLFDVAFVAGVSWWWVVGLSVVAFLWFEVIERWLGLDKRKAHNQMEKARQERVKKNFEK